MGGLVESAPEGAVCRKDEVMSKAKPKKSEKAAKPTKTSAPSKTAKKPSTELSDDDLKQVSGGFGFAAVGTSVVSGEKWIGSNEKWIGAVSDKWIGQ
jgi:bacteriocin-like protein